MGALSGSFETGVDGFYGYHSGGTIVQPIQTSTYGARTGSNSLRTGTSIGAAQAQFYQKDLPNDTLYATTITLSIWAKNVGSNAFAVCRLYVTQGNSNGEPASKTLLNTGPWTQLTLSGPLGTLTAPLKLRLGTDGDNIIWDDWEVTYTVPTSTYCKESGIWKPATKFVRNGGVWKPAKAFVRDGGIWKGV